LKSSLTSMPLDIERPWTGSSSMPWFKSGGTAICGWVQADAPTRAPRARNDNGVDTAKSRDFVDFMWANPS